MLMLHTNVIGYMPNIRITIYYLFQLVMKFEKTKITKRFVIIVQVKYNCHELIIF